MFAYNEPSNEASDKESSASADSDDDQGYNEVFDKADDYKEFITSQERTKRDLESLYSDDEEGEGGRGGAGAPKEPQLP